VTEYLGLSRSRQQKRLMQKYMLKDMLCLNDILINNLKEGLETITPT
jgi:hypothetical protein